MAQFARPDSDVSLGDWVDQGSGVSNIYTSIDESSASDSDYVTNEQMMPSETTAKFGTSDVDDPESSSDHVIRFRARHTGSARDLKVELFQSTTSKASVTQSLSSSFADYSYTLSSSEANSISDYTALRLHLVAVGSSSDALQVSQLYSSARMCGHQTVLGSQPATHTGSS